MNAIAPIDGRQVALLKAVGLDRAAPEQRELAIALADRYGLDLFLKHIVLIEGRPYLTRDAMLHIAHRSGQFDGMTVTKPIIEGDHWTCEATVWRRDMSHPFTYGGRYPAKGKNLAFAPEMAIKSAESMALRRAFDIGAPSADERWDMDLPAEPSAPAPTLAERAAAKVAAIIEPTPPADPDTGEVIEAESLPMALDDAGATQTAAAIIERAQCPSLSPIDGAQCRLMAAHAGLHRTKDQTWPATQEETR